MKTRLRLHHVGIAVQNRDTYERTVKFYRDIIGLAIVRSWSSGAKHITMLDLCGGMLEIVYGAEGEGTGTLAHLALGVEHPEDVQNMLNRCVGFGCSVMRSAQSVEAEEDTGRRFRFWNDFCTGPAGETLEFFCDG